MKSKISAYQTLSSLKKQDNLMLNILESLKSLIIEGINFEYNRTLRIKALSNLSLLSNYTIEHLNYNDNKELALLVRDTLITIEDKASKEIQNEKSENFENVLKHLDHFITLIK